MAADGRRKLNGPQTAGRDLRNLSEPVHTIRFEADHTVTARDGTALMADVYRPNADGKFPALLAVSCYPRQIQNSGAPLGFVEAGATDFWVTRGYGHVIANTRGTGGSGGTYSWLDETERQDLADLVEWVAGQPWCDGNVGMIGISYFAMAQLAAAIEAPPHLKAIFPVAATADIYEAAWHHGLLSSTFISAWISGVATLSNKPNKLFRNPIVDGISNVLRSTPLHDRFAHLNGEAALSALGSVMRAEFDQHPWGELLDDVSVNHQIRDDWWQDRNLLDLIDGCTIPTYLGCDWENVPLHLPSTFPLWQTLHTTAPVRVGMLGAQGLTWPWESLHTEALAWFDHWLKGHDTGIMDGPAIRYWLPGADEFVSTDSWPPSESSLKPMTLRADGVLDVDGSREGSLSYRHQPSEVTRPKGAPAPSLGSKLTWDSDVISEDLDVVGDAELVLDAVITATDTAWIVTLQDIDEAGNATDVTAGWLRASHRLVDESASRPGAPVLPSTSLTAIQPGELTRYRIPLVTTARRFHAGHRIRLVVASDDTTNGHPAIMSFHHQSVAEPSTNTIMATSRLLLPVLEQLS